MEEVLGLLHPVIAQIAKHSCPKQLAKPLLELAVI
jgi:hypothetical protein